MHRDISRLHVVSFAALVAPLLLSNQIALAQGQLSTTTGISSVEASVSFSNSTLNQPNQFLLGGANPATIWANPNARFTDGVTSAVLIPSTATVYQSNGFNANVQNSSTKTAAVAGYFTSICNASSTLCWGSNSQASDGTGTLTGVIMYGQETDVNVQNTDTSVTGHMIHASFTAQPKAAWALRIVSAPGTPRWKVGYETDDGAVLPTGSGLGLGATNTTANSYSQILSLSGIDTNGAHQISTLQATPSGGLNFGVANGGNFFGFYNGPVALNTLAASTSSAACLNSTTWNGLDLIAACTSLRKYKGNIKRLRPSLAEVMQLEPVSYVSKTNGNAEIGFVAEDIEKVDKRLSTYHQGELIGVQYDHMVALLTKAVQEQQAQIHEQNAQITELRQQLQDLKRAPAP
jgi:hypothetical protein